MLTGRAARIFFTISKRRGDRPRSDAAGTGRPPNHGTACVIVCWSMAESTSCAARAITRRLVKRWPPPAIMASRSSRCPDPTDTCAVASGNRSAAPRRYECGLSGDGAGRFDLPTAESGGAGQRRLERVLRACRQIAPEQRVMQPLPALDVAWYARLLARLADDRPDFVLRRRPVRARASSDWRTAIMPGCTDRLASARLLPGVG